MIADVAAAADLYRRRSDVAEDIAIHLHRARTIVMIQGPDIERDFDVVKIVSPDDAATLGRIAAVIERPVVFNVHADVVDIVVLHGLVVPQHQDGHGGRLIKLAAGYAVAQTAHGDAHPVLHLDAVEMMDDAVFDIIVPPDNPPSVSAAEFDPACPQVIEFTARQAAIAAGGIQDGGDMPHSMNTALLQARIPAAPHNHGIPA